jgi:hypothetical protein
MRYEGQASHIDEFAENAAHLMNLPHYYEEVGEDVSYLQDIYQKYGAETAIRIATLAYIASIAFTPQSVYAQDYIDSDLPPIEVPEINPIAEFLVNQTPNTEIIASEAVSESAIQVDSVETLLEVIKKGLSSKTYEVKFKNSDAELLIKQYLKNNKLFLSTGNVIVPLDAQTIKQIFGSNFNFLLENDTQGVQKLAESRRFNDIVEDPSAIPSETITTTNQVQLEDGLIKTTTTVTDTEGVITNTVQYNADDWGYLAGKTLTGDLIASGRMLIAASPYLRLRNFDDPNLHTEVRFQVLYAGGYTTQSGLFVPNFKYEPLFEKDTPNYHGRVIGENLGALTSGIENLVLINADAMTYINESSGLSANLAEVLYEANNTLDTNYNLYVSESIGGAITRHSRFYNYLKKIGVDYRGFIHSFASAGNNGTILTVNTMDPDWSTQVVALNPERTALTGYTNYGLDTNLYLGERGDFYAVSPFIDDKGNLIYIPRKHTGTSMATPLIAAQAVINDNKIINDIAPISMLFPEVKNIIYGSPANGGILTVEQLIYQLRVGNGVLPNFDRLDKTMYALSADRIKANLDPQFYSFVVEDEEYELSYRLFFPMILGSE